MTTATPRPRPDLAPPLFLLWAALVLGAYLPTHPLPLRAEVPVGRGLLLAALLLVVTLPLWWPARRRRGPQVEHLVLVPVALTAGLAMLPVTARTALVGEGGAFLLCVWGFVALLLRRRFGGTGVLLALLLWFPGRFILTVPALTAFTGIVCVLLAPWLWLARGDGGEPRRRVRHCVAAVLALGVLLSLADLQRRYHPVGFLSGVVGVAAWRSACALETSDGSRALLP